MTVQVVGCDDNKPSQVDCNHCGVVLSYHSCDVETKHEWQEYGSFEDVIEYHLITCPACQKKVHV